MGPIRSGRIAAVIIVCQPAWQLAITIGLAVGVRMPAGDLFEKKRFRRGRRVLDRLTRHRLGREADEIARVTGAGRDPDLAARLHAPDARPVTGARVDHDDWRLRGIDGGRLLAEGCGRACS